MDWFETLVARAAGIPLPARVALACQCAERAHPVYQALREDADEAAFMDATECGWRFALSGERDDDAILSITQRIEALLQNYIELDHDLMRNVVTVPLRALQTMQGDEKASALAAARALVSALDIDVADLADEAMLMAVDEEDPQDGMAGEQRWQAAALEIAESWRGHASRSMFTSIGGDGGLQWAAHILATQQ